MTCWKVFLEEFYPKRFSYRKGIVYFHILKCLTADITLTENIGYKTHSLPGFKFMPPNQLIHLN